MSEMVNDDFTKTLNDFAAKFNVPAMEIYVLAAECIMVGKHCQRMADMEAHRSRSKREGTEPPNWEEWDNSLRELHRKHHTPVN